MLNTYLNDNQAMPYPFYGLGAMPFPMCVIAGLGLCIKLDAPADTVNAIYASNVQINKDSVNVALCRKNEVGGRELVGLVYANTSGYYMYLPGYAPWQYDVVYEDQTYAPDTPPPWPAPPQPTPQQVLRYVLHGDTEAISQYIAEDSVDATPFYELQVFYSTCVNTQTQDDKWTTTYLAIDPAADALSLSQLFSTGYMQLGSIPEDAIGNYSGEFYLDPSCVTYMPSSVYTGVESYTVNRTSYTSGQRFDIEANGLLKLELTGTTAALGTYGITDDVLTDLPFVTRKQVTSVNGYSALATEDTAEPTLTIKVATNKEYAIQLSSTVGTSEHDPVIIEVNGTTAFPNCDRGD